MIYRSHCFAKEALPLYKRIMGNFTRSPRVRNKIKDDFRKWKNKELDGAEKDFVNKKFFVEGDIDKKSAEGRKPRRIVLEYWLSCLKIYEPVYLTRLLSHIGLYEKDFPWGFYPKFEEKIRKISMTSTINMQNIGDYNSYSTSLERSTYVYFSEMRRQDYNPPVGVDLSPPAPPKKKARPSKEKDGKGDETPPSKKKAKTSSSCTSSDVRLRRYFNDFNSAYVFNDTYRELYENDSDSELLDYVKKFKLDRLEKFLTGDDKAERLTSLRCSLKHFMLNSHFQARDVLFTTKQIFKVSEEKELLKMKVFMKTFLTYLPFHMGVFLGEMNEKGAYMCFCSVKSLAFDDEVFPSVESCARFREVTGYESCASSEGRTRTEVLLHLLKKGDRGKGATMFQYMVRKFLHGYHGICNKTLFKELCEEKKALEKKGNDCKKINNIISELKSLK